MSVLIGKFHNKNAPLQSLGGNPIILRQFKCSPEIPKESFCENLMKGFEQVDPNLGKLQICLTFHCSNSGEKQSAAIVQEVAAGSGSS